MTQELRMTVWEDTRKRCYEYPSKPSIKLQYERNYIFPIIFSNTNVEVTNEDTIDSGLRLKNSGLHPLCLNFADDLYPGGCYGQEESLFRRTNLCLSLLESLYPIQSNEAIYSPLITVFKDTEVNKYKLIKPEHLSFISAPAINNPKLVLNRFTREQVKYFEEKILLIFQVAKKNGHDSLVLGPLGCGAWHCPPKQVAELFKSAIHKFNGLFKTIVFACYNYEEADENLNIFSNVFNNNYT
jgi:uncharacterized protein (TIGR02452 family)